jgi:hypothetical protein
MDDGGWKKIMGRDDDRGEARRGREKERSCLSPLSPLSSLSSLPSLLSPLSVSLHPTSRRLKAEEGACLTIDRNVESEGTTN